jgi:hypothetical protein
VIDSRFRPKPYIGTSMPQFRRLVFFIDNLIFVDLPWQTKFAYIS